MICSLLFLVVGQGSIPERTKLTDTLAMSLPEWKNWSKSNGVELSLTNDFAGSPGPFSGGLFERLDLLALALGKRLRIRHQSVLIESGSKGIISQGSRFCRGEVESVVLSNQLDEGRGFMSIGVQVAWHPKLHPILIQAGTFHFGSRNGKSFVSRPTSWQAVEEDFVAQLQLKADKPPRSLPGFDSLEGNIRMVVPNQLLWLDLGGLTDRGEQPDFLVGKTKVRRLGAQVSSRRVSLEVEIQPGPSEYTIESYQEGVLTGLATLIGPGNFKRNADGQQILESGNGKIRVRYDWLISANGLLNTDLGDKRFDLRVGDNYKEMETFLKFGAIDLP